MVAPLESSNRKEGSGSGHIVWPRGTEGQRGGASVELADKGENIVLVSGSSVQQDESPRRAGITG